MEPSPLPPDPRQRALARAELWRLAASLFRYPSRDDPAPERLDDPAPWETARRAAHVLEDPEVVRTLARAAESFRSLGPEAIEAAYELAFGHAARGAVPPYETEWGGAGGFLQPQALADLSGWYRAHGLALAPGADRHDHASVECEFLQFLARKEAHAMARGETERRAECRVAAGKFLAEHLGRFAPALGARLAREPGEGPYAAAGEFLRALAGAECAELGVRSGEEGLPLRAVSFEEEADCMRCTARRSGPLPVR